jgi:HEAT repeat protein
VRINTRLLHIVLAFSLVAILGCECPDEPIQAPATASPESEAEQVKRIALRLDRVAPGMLNQISFTMVHCAGEKAIDVFMKAVGSPNEHGKGFSFESAVREAGGLAKYRRRVAKLLTNKDEVVRGYGADWLGMVGDETCKADLARLLKERALPTESDVMAGFGREEAASALGMLGAREYANVLVDLLEDPNGRVRAGAATGLALMKATEHADAIAKLVDDRASERDVNADRARTAGFVALVALDAKQHAPTIAKQLTRHDGARDSAIYALVALDAKAQARDLSTLLKDRFRGGNAAVALALLGATEYADAIGNLLRLKDEEDFGFVRSKAAFAVGVLQTQKYIPEIVELMKSPKDYNQVVAAWALVMMESQEHASQAITIIKHHKREDCRDLWMPDEGEFIASAQFYAVEERARKSLAKLLNAMEKNELSGPKKKGDLSKPPGKGA